tara:strand:+ start:80 stop:2953 length:2874 start_codon:yes stop_codon:yes gene_type:complete
MLGQLHTSATNKPGLLDLDDDLLHNIFNRVPLRASSLAVVCQKLCIFIGATATTFSAQVFLSHKMEGNTQDKKSFKAKSQQSCGIQIGSLSNGLENPNTNKRGAATMEEHNYQMSKILLSGIETTAVHKEAGNGPLDQNRVFLCARNESIRVYMGYLITALCQRKKCLIAESSDYKEYTENGRTSVKAALAAARYSELVRIAVLAKAAYPTVLEWLIRGMKAGTENPLCHAIRRHCGDGDVGALEFYELRPLTDILWSTTGPLHSSRLHQDSAAYEGHGHTSPTDKDVVVRTVLKAIMTDKSRHFHATFANRFHVVRWNDTIFDNTEESWIEEVLTADSRFRLQKALEHKDVCDRAMFTLSTGTLPQEAHSMLRGFGLGYVDLWCIGKGGFRLIAARMDKDQVEKEVNRIAYNTLDFIYTTRSDENIPSNEEIVRQSVPGSLWKRISLPPTEVGLRRMVTEVHGVGGFDDLSSWVQNIQSTRTSAAGQLRRTAASMGIRVGDLIPLANGDFAEAHRGTVPFEKGGGTKVMPSSFYELVAVLVTLFGQHAKKPVITFEVADAVQDSKNNWTHPNDAALSSVYVKCRPDIWIVVDSLADGMVKNITRLKEWENVFSPFVYRRLADLPVTPLCDVHNLRLKNCRTTRPVAERLGEVEPFPTGIIGLRHAIHQGRMAPIRSCDYICLPGGKFLVPSQFADDVRISCSPLKWVVVANKSIYMEDEISTLYGYPIASYFGGDDAVATFKSVQVTPCKNVNDLRVENFLARPSRQCKGEVCMLPANHKDFRNIAAVLAFHKMDPVRTSDYISLPCGKFLVPSQLADNHLEVLHARMQTRAVFISLMSTVEQTQSSGRDIFVPWHDPVASFDYMVHSYGSKAIVAAFRARNVQRAKLRKLKNSTFVPCTRTLESVFCKTLLKQEAAEVAEAKRTPEGDAADALVASRKERILTLEAELQRLKSLV